MKETTRPVIYRLMKYWGKKPHNIWNNYIKKYSKKNDVVLDPFVGSGMTYFESIKSERIPYTIDINPISDLCIKCLTYRNINKSELIYITDKIIDDAKKTDWYKNEFVCKCSFCGEYTDIYNYKTTDRRTISYKCAKCGKTITDNIILEEKEYEIKYWFPTKKLSDIDTVSESFIKKIGGNNIKYLWSNRNLLANAYIFDCIMHVDNSKIKDLLMFGFIQSLHLTTKMCIPRSDKSNRPLSTSWGRPAFIISDKTFEQNPLIAFEKAIKNSTGVINGLKSSEEYLGNKVNKNAIHKLGNSYDILKKIADESIDLIITDPPYGNIIQYGDLSEVWVSWLEHYNKEYYISHESEVIVNNKKNQLDYSKKLTDIFMECKRVLKSNSVMIITFNSNSNEDWKSLLTSIKDAGMFIEKFIYQKNKRSSEANVAAKEGIAICDYYFICKKGEWTDKYIKDLLDERRIELNGRNN